jgi:tRNA threonylcarbamoyladenosine biosynthesis protein TsaE
MAMNFTDPIITDSFIQTQHVGFELAPYILNLKKNTSKAILICLYGDLGNGKTTFVQGLADALDIKGRIISPTFIILKRYKINLSELYLYHLDLYRINHESEIENLGIKEILDDKDSIVIIEWAEKMKQILPILRIDIKFKYITENRRSISINSSYPI